MKQHMVFAAIISDIAIHSLNAEASDTSDYRIKPIKALCDIGQ